MSDLSWIRVSGRRPTFEQSGTLLVEPATERLLWLDRGEAWAMGSERTWARLDLAIPDDDAIESDAPVVAWTTTSGHAVVGRFTADALRVHAVAAPEAGQSFPFPKPDESIGEAFAFVHDDTVHVHLSTSNEGRTYALRGDAFVKVTDGPYLLDIAYDPAQRRAVAYDVRRTVHTFDGRTWSESGRVDFEPQSLAWHPDQQSVVTFRASSGDGMTLQRIDGQRCTPVDPEVTAPAYRNGGELAVGTDGTVVFFGGQDFDKGGSPTDETFVASPGQAQMSSDMRDDPPPMGGYDTLVTTTQRLVHVNHSKVEITTHTDGVWSNFAELPLSREDMPYAVRDDRFVNFTAWGEHVWMLDAEGGLWEAPRNGEFRSLPGTGGGPGGRYSNRISLAYDVERDRVISFGGIDRNDTWAYDRRTQRWEELRPSHPPPLGIAAAVTTDSGIYALADGELWWFAADRWSCVGADVPGTTLAFDPKRSRLLLLGWSRGDDDQREAVWTWEGDRARELTALPTDVHIVQPYQSGAYAAVDPDSDRLLVMGQTEGTFALPLDTLSPGALPTQPIEPPTKRLATPPANWTRPAMALTRSEQRLSRVPKLGVKIEGTLVAVVQGDDVAMPLPAGYGAIALSAIDNWYEDTERYQPWLLGGGGYYATLIPTSATDASFIVEDGVAYALVCDAFTEVDPEHVLEVDTPSGNALALAYGSKLGGYPNLIQDDPTESWDGAPLKFAFQLTGSLYEVGDWGSTYVWISESPARGYAIMQSH